MNFDFRFNQLNRERATAIITAVALALVGIFLLLLILPADFGRHDKIGVTIEAGQGLRAIANELKSKDIIRSKYVFMLYVLAMGQDGNLKAGTYLISPDQNIPQVAYIISQGLSVSNDITVVIPEGYNIWEIDQRLQDVGLNSNHEFARKYYLHDGYFFPDTYRFKKGTSLEEIAQKMESNFVAKYGIPSSQIRIMASMLEKEARTKEDSELIAGIILRRIHLGMTLQIDATVAYGWCVDRFVQKNFSISCDVTQAPIAFEIKKDGVFNTYIRTGFPPRPISNPGKVALDAAKHPKVSDYLYYLSTRDGKIIYAKTASEQEANRRKYLGL
ncbi:MAG TPA: endolytic transglycosylase MltG [Candidatus Paceibacterota bacterium]|nr:endolytic transglycosylase MltG [Candidatus Paceibacterota bacterium]